MNWQLEFAKEIHERMLVLLWRQWAQLGLASAHVPRRDGWVIDPEALLLTTLVVGRRDPRLFDEAVDWLLKNAHFINLPRAKSLSRRFCLGGDVRVLAAVCDSVCAQEKSLNWHVPVTTTPPPAPEPFFLQEDGSPQPAFGVSDPVFLRYGYHRGALHFRGLSRRFNRVMPECALLRLRALLGVTARAEILLYLMTHKTAHPSGVARETGYSQKNVQDAMVDMEASGIIHSCQLEGRKKNYFMLARDRKPFLHRDEPPPIWVCWPPLWRSLTEIWEEMEKLANREASPLALAVDLLALAARVRPHLESAGYAHCLAGLPQERGEACIPAFETAIRALFSELDEHTGRAVLSETATDTTQPGNTTETDSESDSRV